MRTSPGVDARELKLKATLARATSTGLRVMGVRISGYAVGFVASVLIARSIGPVGRGLYAYPVALLGIVMALAHVGLEFAQVHLAARGQPLRQMWADATVFSVIAGTVCWVIVAGVVAIDPRISGGLSLSWIAVSMGLVPLLLMSLYLGEPAPARRSTRDGGMGSSWFGVALQAVAIGVLFFTHELTPFRILLLQWLTNGAAWLLLLLSCHRRPGEPSGGSGSAPAVGSVRREGICRADLFLSRTACGSGAGRRVRRIPATRLVRARHDGRRVAMATDRSAGRCADAACGAGAEWGRQTTQLLDGAAESVDFSGSGHWRIVSGAARHPAHLWCWICRLCTALRLLLPGVVALGAARPLGAVLIKEGRVLITSVMGLGALGLNVALNVTLLPWIGIRGASIASSVCYAALALSYVAISQHRDVAGWRDLIPRTSDLHLIGTSRRDRRAERRAGPLRVAFVVGSLNRGGTEGQILAMGSALVLRGHLVTVICLDSAGDQVVAARTAGIRVIEVGFRGLRWPMLLNLFPVVRRIRGILRESSPDVVHCFLYWGYLFGVPIARSIGAPVVISSRRSLTAAFKRPRLLFPWEWVCDRLADAVVCNSSAVMEDAIQHTRLPRRKAIVIRNGVSLPADSIPPSPRPQRMVILANLKAYKGHAVALTAFAQMRALTPTLEVRLQLAGSGPEEGPLRAQAREYGVDEDIDFLGSVADVPALLAACSFTVLASLSEGMPNAVLESLAHGRAVIASAVGGVPEILSHGGGVLVPPGDAHALAEAMATLLADPVLAARLGAEGRVFVRDRFGTDRMVGESLQLYRGLLAGKSPRESGLDPADRPGISPLAATILPLDDQIRSHTASSTTSVRS